MSNSGKNSSSASLDKVLESNDENSPENNLFSEEQTKDLEILKLEINKDL